MMMDNKYLNLCMLGKFCMLFLASADFFVQIKPFHKLFQEHY